MAITRCLRFPTASSLVGTRASLGSELSRLRITRPLVVTDAGLVESGLIGEVAASIAPGFLFSGVQSQSDGSRRSDGPGAVPSRTGLRRPGRTRRRQPDRRGQGDPATGDASGPARRLRLNAGGLDGSRPNLPPMVAIPTTAGHRQRGRPRDADPASPDRPQDDCLEPLPAAERGDLRPRADPGICRPR